jgi:hypothetical protein
MSGAIFSNEVEAEAKLSQIVQQVESTMHEEIIYSILFIHLSLSNWQMKQRVF